MFVINEDKSIYLTRGDVAFFSVSVKSDTGEVRKFQPGEVVRFKVYGKKNCENVVLQKDFGIEEETEKATIYLEEKDTKIGDVISKPTTYWYEVELNPYTNPQTIIGYDDDGAKVFMLYPEGNEAEDNDPITPEDIPVVDAELSLTSTRPVQNQAIARAIATIKQDVNTEVSQKLSQELARVDALIRGASGGIGREEYELVIPFDADGNQIDGIMGKVTSNGINAILELTLENITIPFYNNLVLTNELPNRLNPLGSGLQTHIFALDEKYPNVYVVFSGSTILISNETDNEVNITSPEEFSISYSLANPYITEISDARFGTDGESYDTLGNALRGEINKVLAKLDDGHSSTTSIRMDIGTARVTSNGINAVMELTLNGLEIPEWSNIIICSNFPLDLYPLGIGQPTFTLDKKYPNIDVIFNGAEIIISNRTDERVVVEYGERFNIQYALEKPHII